VSTMHDRALSSPVEVPRPVDAVVRIMVRAVGMVSRRRREPVTVLVSLDEWNEMRNAVEQARYEAARDVYEMVERGAQDPDASARRVKLRTRG
jgi:hypothetical protein